MAKGTRNTVVLMGLAMALVGTSRMADAQVGDVPAATSAMRPTRIRTENPAIATLIEKATSRSETFRALVAAIEQTDGLVYVLEGSCGHGVRACMPHRITKLGPNRMLRIFVDPRRTDQDLMGAIGHELQHAVEVLSESSVDTDAELHLLYSKLSSEVSGRFETAAAIQAGGRVRAEVRAN
jgi:hypothetical protein